MIFLNFRKCSALVCDFYLFPELKNALKGGHTEEGVSWCPVALLWKMENSYAAVNG
jgi:hypothetical protein